MNNPTPRDTLAKLASVQCLLRLSESVVGVFTHYKCTDPESSEFGTWHIAVATGFVLDFKGGWMLLTAGHYFHQLDSDVAEGKIEIKDIIFIDYIHGNTPNLHKIPVIYDYDRLKRGYIFDDDKGLDICIISLDSYLTEHFKKSNIKAITEPKWTYPGEKAYDEYRLIGLPFEKVKLKPGSSYNQHFPDVSFQPASLPIKRLTPTDIHEAPITDWPRFIGKIDTGDIIDDIVGMSGGPIYGIEHIDGGIKYRIVAIQSGWRKQSRIVFACLIPEFMTILAQGVQRQSEALGLTFDEKGYATNTPAS